MIMIYCQPKAQIACSLVGHVCYYPIHTWWCNNGIVFSEFVSILRVHIEVTTMFSWWCNFIMTLLNNGLTLSGSIEARYFHHSFNGLSFVIDEQSEFKLSIFHCFVSFFFFELLILQKQTHFIDIIWEGGTFLRWVQETSNNFGRLSR